jgi:hypothetical protein
MAHRHAIAQRPAVDYLARIARFAGLLELRRQCVEVASAGFEARLNRRVLLFAGVRERLMTGHARSLGGTLELGVGKFEGRHEQMFTRKTLARPTSAAPLTTLYARLGLPALHCGAGAFVFILLHEIGEAVDALDGLQDSFYRIGCAQGFL